MCIKSAELGAGSGTGDAKVLQENADGTRSWVDISGTGAGDVTGPASATDNAITRFDGTTGKLLQNSGITIADGASGTLAGSNSGDVTLAGTPTYLTIAAQVITRGLIDLAAHVTGRLPFANLAQVSASRWLGRGSASGTGDAQELTAGKNLAFNGTAVDVSVPLTNDGNSGTALTLDFGSAPFSRHTFTLTGNVTLTLSNPLDGGTYVITIATGAGSFTVTWPGSVLWPGGTAPVITTTASKVDLVTLLYNSSTTKYYGSFNQNY